MSAALNNSRSAPRGSPAAFRARADSLTSGGSQEASEGYPEGAAEHPAVPEVI